MANRTPQPTDAGLREREDYLARRGRWPAMFK
jgi:hypothetical protein